MTIVFVTLLEDVGGLREDCMTDEKLIELFRKIKGHCQSKEWCPSCPFFDEKDMLYNQCQIMNLGSILSNVPSCWNMEEIERIIRL